MSGFPVVSGEPSTPLWAKVIDNTRCIGCHACTVACKSENQVPLAVTRTYVKYVDQGLFPNARRAFQVTRCNMCDDAPCVTACPTRAMYRRADGIVDFDKSICIGCKACIAACPYDAIFINPEDNSAEKCNFCTHRLDVGLEPACVVVCPTEAILVGDLGDPEAKVSRIVHREPVQVRRPEKATQPKLFYRGGHHATLDPLAARRPEGGLFMWSEQGDGPGRVTSGNPSAGTSAAAALLSYDVAQHRIPWGIRVSLYTWTKSIAAGSYIVPALLGLAGLASWTGPMWAWAAPMAAVLFLALTAALLIWDLKHPWRFYLILTRPQWQSWLVRGAVILIGFGAVIALHLAASWLAVPGFRRWLVLAGLPLASLAAVYTAYLFAQARARDLWQSPLLPPNLMVHAILAGAATLAPVAVWIEPGATAPLLWLVGGASLLHVLFTAGELTLTHGTAHVRLAHDEMVRGRYRRSFWAGLILVAVGVLAPWLGPWAAGPALAGLLASEHALVQAGQSVPLA